MTVWPVLHYDDPDAAVRFLVDVLGFADVLVVRDADGDVVHAELGHGTGRLVLGGTKHTGGVHEGTGPQAVYVVTDDVDAVGERAAAAGADVVVPPGDTAFGAGVPTRACTVRDPEGGLWTFGAYQGAG